MLFERFSEGAYAVVRYAEHEAQVRGHEAVTPAHLVVALTMPTRLGQRLEALGLRTDDLRAALPPVEPEPTVEPPLDADIRFCFGETLRAAMREGDTVIHVRHLATGLGRHVEEAPDGAAARMLASAGVTLEQLRITVAAAEAAAIPPAPDWLTAPLRGHRRTTDSAATPATPRPGQRHGVEGSPSRRTGGPGEGGGGPLAC